MVGRSFGGCLRNRLLLLGCAMRFTTRSFECTEASTVLRVVATDFSFNYWSYRSLRITVFNMSLGSATIVRKTYWKRHKFSVLETKNASGMQYGGIIELPCSWHRLGESQI
jgi:hypothetical protein